MTLAAIATGALLAVAAPAAFAESPPEFFNLFTASPTYLDSTTAANVYLPGDTFYFGLSDPDNNLDAGATTCTVAVNGGSPAPATCDPIGGTVSIPGLDSGGHYVIEINAQDTLGNTATLVQELYVNNDLNSPGGAMTLGFDPSSTAAGHHPDLLLDLQNSTDGNPSSITMSLPDGFVGSLKAVPDATKCPYPGAPTYDFTDMTVEHPDSEVDAWCPSSQRHDSTIGSVRVEAKIDQSTTRLTGTVLLTQRKQAGEPAGIAVVVPVQVGDDDLGNIVVPAQLKLRASNTDPNNGDIDSTPTGADTVIPSIPDTFKPIGHPQLSSLKLIRTRVWIYGSPESTTPGADPAHPWLQAPVLTNPSSCSELPIPISITDDNGAQHILQDSYQSTGCDEQPFNPQVSMSYSSVAAGSSTTITSDVTVPDGSTTIKQAILDLPVSIRQRTSAISQPCSPNDIKKTPPACVTSGSYGDDTHSHVGTFTVTSPLLTTPVAGDVWLVDSGGAIPYIYLYAKDDNLGLIVRARGNATPVSQPFGNHIRVRFNWRNGQQNLPDLPVSSLHLELPGSTADGQITEVTNSSTCIGNDTASFRIESWTGRVAVGLVPQTFTGCTATPNPNLKFDDSTDFSGTSGQEKTGMGGVTTDAQPTLNYEVTGADASPTPTFKCALDDPSGIAGSDGPPLIPDYQVSHVDAGTAPPFNFLSSTACGGSGSLAGSFTPAAPLRDGVHVLAVQASGFKVGGVDQTQTRFVIFRVNDAPPDDTTGPDATITTGPANSTSTADTTPTFGIHSDPGSKFECRIDKQSYEACGSDIDSSGDATFTPSDPLVADIDDQTITHTLDVRAADDAGNYGATDSRSFTIDVPFDQSHIDFLATPSTTKARAHPTLQVTVTSDSNHDLRNLHFSLPNGFVGSLLGAVEQCSKAGALAHSCPADSKVGTLTATAQADLSTVTTTGDVYLTEPLQAGDPAGVALVVHAKVDTLDLGDIWSLQRLVVRGNAQGVDAISLGDIPRSIEDAANGNAKIYFHLRSVTLDLVDGAGASQPLLTNPSDCTPSAYSATFGSWDATPASVDQSQPYQTTDCDSLPFYTGFTAQIVKEGTTSAVPAPRDTVDMHATVTTSPDDSGVKTAVVTLPAAVSVNVSNVPLGCHYDSYQATKICPETSVIGTATATTPLLPNPLTGKIYLISYLPSPLNQQETLELVIQLRGLINVDLVGHGILQNFRFTTTFNDVPDAPVNSFTVSVGRILAIRSDACGAYVNSRTINGGATSYNGKTSPYNVGVNIACRGEARYAASIRGKGKKITGAINADATGGVKMKRLTVYLPHGVKTVKRKFKRHVRVYSDGKRVKRPCFKIYKTKFVVYLCHGKAGLNVRLRFGRGSLSARKLPRHPAFKVTAIYLNGNSERVRIKLSGRKLRHVSVKRY